MALSAYIATYILDALRLFWDQSTHGYHHHGDHSRSTSTRKEILSLILILYGILRVILIYVLPTQLFSLSVFLINVVLHILKFLVMILSGANPHLLDTRLRLEWILLSGFQIRISGFSSRLRSHIGRTVSSAGRVSTRAASIIQVIVS